MMTLIKTSNNNSQMHNDIMATGSRECPPILETGRYAQWQSHFMIYIDTRPNSKELWQCIYDGPYNTTPRKLDYFDAEDEAIHLILTGIGDDIYSIVDACTTAKEIWIAIERLQQAESLNKQYVKTNNFWEFGKFTSRDGESIESYYSRFYKMVNEIVRNKLEVATMQVNIQFLHQLQPEWSRFMTVVKQTIDLDKKSYHKLFDILKQYQNEVNEICVEKLARNKNPLAFVATTQHYPEYHNQAPEPNKSIAHSSNQTTTSKLHAFTRHKGKEIAKPFTPPSESASDKDSDLKQAQRDKQLQKNLALIAKKPKRVKEYAYHKEKMLLYKQAKKGVHLSADQEDWLDDTNEESDVQELEAHYLFIAKISEISTAELGPTFDDEPMEKCLLKLLMIVNTGTYELVLLGLLWFVHTAVGY
ncbi:hypothetical protein Tco_1508521 [Tanacetum coccineum]